MDSSTKEILKRTIAITETHVETDKSGIITEQWGDVSISYKGYTKYDTVKVNCDSSNIDTESVRHTHLYVSNNIQEEINAINKYYAENNLGPYKYAFGNNISDTDNGGV